MPRLAALAAGAFLAASATGCGTAASVPPGPAQPALPTLPATLTAAQLATLRAAGQADASFGLNVLTSRCRQDPRANLAFSPASLASGLGMAYLGARGTTQAAMSGVLGLPAGRAALLARLRTRTALLGSLDRPGVTVSISNRIWADPSLVTDPPYLAALRAGYQARLAHLPLLTAPGQARQAINAAVAADTRGHIPALLPPGSLDHTGWLLTDALYLNAAWRNPFDPAETMPGRFTTAAGQPVTAHYLNGSGFAAARDQGWTAVALPYRGGRLAMLALLPPAGPGCPALAPATLTAVSRALAAPGAPLTAVSLPKVSMAASTSMDPVLEQLGMGIAFTSSADFSGLSRQACCIGLVQHAATLAVAEKGTVASAATSVGIIAGAAPAPRSQVVFNRPYLLLVADTVTGEPLLLARVADPARG